MADAGTSRLAALLLLLLSFSPWGAALPAAAEGALLAGFLLMTDPGCDVDAVPFGASTFVTIAGAWSAGRSAWPPLKFRHLTADARASADAKATPKNAANKPERAGEERQGTHTQLKQRRIQHASPTRPRPPPRT